MLSQVYSIAYSKIAEIQLQLSKYLESVKVMLIDPARFVVAGRRSETGTFSTTVEIYSVSGMKSEIKAIRDCIAALNEDVNDLNRLD